MKTIEILKDKEGRTIEVGQQCEAYNENGYFNGEILGFKAGLVSVEDQEGDVFNIEPFEVEIFIDLREIADKEGLDYIETTTGTNGYPQNIKVAITGFKDFTHAREIADKYKLSIESFESREGWRLWSRNSRTMYEAYPMSADIFGDNYTDFIKMSEQDFLEQEVTPFLEDFESFKDLEEFLDIKKEIWQEIEKMDEDEMVISCYGEYAETLKQNPMSFYHDTREYIIGLID